MSRETIKKMYKSLTNDWETICIHEKELEKEKDIYEKRLLEYRIAEVNYVLENVASLIRTGKTDLREIGTYLCHCQNKLNGNIDGVILNFDICDRLEGDE